MSLRVQLAGQQSQRLLKVLDAVRYVLKPKCAGGVFGVFLRLHDVAHVDWFCEGHTLRRRGRRVIRVWVVTPGEVRVLGLG